MIRPADLLRTAKHRYRVRRALAEIAARPERLRQRAHALDTPLIVSLTSYRARFATLHHTLRALLWQSTPADRVILWIARDEFADLPDAVRTLRSDRFEIAATDDLRSYKKIVPALVAMPEATIVTADDDTYYGPDWLESLCASGAPVACHRAHRITLTADGVPRPYAAWDRNTAARGPDGAIFPTGVGGVLYRPGVFHQDVTRADLFRDLAPSADDVWLYWMHRLAGSRPRKSGGALRIIEWPDTQRTALRTENLGRSANDVAIAAMIRRYGFPQIA